MKRKVLVTTGTRADYGILRPILKEILRNKKTELFLVVTGSHLSKEKGLTINEIKKDGFKIDGIIKAVPNDDTNYSIVLSFGKMILGFAKILKKIQPDVNVVLGDRYEMLASAIASSHFNIPTAHIHGGDTSGGLDEYVRHSITKLSNIHFPATKKSYTRLIKLGENPKFVFLCGSPSIDEILNEKITPISEIKEKYNLEMLGKEILFVYHPLTTDLKETKKEIVVALKSLTNIKRQVIIIGSNIDSGNNLISNYIKLFQNKSKNIKYFANLPRRDYLSIMKNCGIFVGNSSSGLVEASCFGTPVINLGTRQKNRERGKNVTDLQNFSESSLTKMILKLNQKYRKPSFYIFGDGTASKKIVNYLIKTPINDELLKKQITY